MGGGDFPTVLTAQFGHLGITEKQASSLKARLDYIEEIIEKVHAWISRKSELETLALFLDDLEVDFSVNQNVTLDESKGLEPGWIIHHAWTTDVEAKPFKKYLSPSVRQGLDQRLLPLNAADEEVEVWLKDQTDLLREILDGIYASESIESTAAHLIALDAILPYQLACLVKARLK